MLLTFEPSEIEALSAWGARTIDFFIPRASGRPGDLHAAHLTGALRIRALPAEWIGSPSAHLRWIELSRKLHPDAFDQATVRSHGSLFDPICEEAGSLLRLSFQLPAIEDAELSPGEAERLAAALLSRHPRASCSPHSWAIYEKTGQIARALLFERARLILSALNSTAPGACLPEPLVAPFGWVSAGELAPLFRAQDERRALEAAAAPATAAERSRAL